MELQLRHQALHDPLTGLSNRTLCQNRIQQSLERSKRRTNYYFAVVFVDLDRFKVINDSLGHNAGDKLLVEVGQRLLQNVRELDTVARFGGDEFVLLLEELLSPRDAIRTIKRIRDSLREGFLIDGHEVMITSSFGIVLDPTIAHSPEELLRNADIAMHLAKERGKDRFKVFSPKLLDQAVRLLTIENDLRRALVNREFYIVYQPILELEDTRLIGFEALVRWEHPQKGLIRPNEFIPIAEDTGLILDLGAFVLRQAAETMAEWRSRLPQAQDLLLSVNVSGKQFAQHDIVEQVRTVLQSTGLPAERLKLEITETAIMEHAANSVGKLKKLKDMGASLSIDDFGTGYSSMSYLQQFPLDHLKIDLSFIRQLTTHRENIEIVKGIISLAHSLNLKVVAEGVEKVEQANILRGMHCDYAQGYLYAKPLPQSEAEAFIVSNLGGGPYSR